MPEESKWNPLLVNNKIREIMKNDAYFKRNRIIFIPFNPEWINKKNKRSKL